VEGENAKRHECDRKTFAPPRVIVFQVSDHAENPTVLFRLTCSAGHPWIAYGSSKDTHWGPPQCPKCAESWETAETVAELTQPPRHRYAIRLRQRAGVPVHEQVVLADSYEQREGAFVFLTGPHIVARYRQAVAEPVMID
jgi:hypothetical protein